MGEVAARRPAVADLRMGNLGEGLGQDWMAPPGRRVALQPRITDHGTDMQRPVQSHFQPIEAQHPVQIHEHGRLDEAEVHGRHQALAAGEEPSLFPMCGLEGKRLLQGLRGMPEEGGGLHGGLLMSERVAELRGATKESIAEPRPWTRTGSVT